MLLSGGIDSTTALFWAIDRKKKVTALTFDYSQRNRIEIRLAQKLTQSLGIPHDFLSVDLAQIGGSALTDSKKAMPAINDISEIDQGPPVTYVPFRNGIFLSLAAAWAEVQGINEIICGFHVMDSPDYPDTRETFVKAMATAINLGTKAFFNQTQFSILAPFIDWNKAQIIQKGLELKADYSYSISCYRGKEIPCQSCSACLLRANAWKEAGQSDPLLERLKKEGKI